MNSMNRFVFLLVVSLLLPVHILSGQELASEKRMALVIGNGDYLVGPLPNPVNDARSMARALRSVGFDVMLRENVSNQTEMKRVIREFGQKLKNFDVGLFYFAGHGIQKDGYNFLVPVNAEINNEEEVEYECVDAGFVVALMDAADSRVNIIILDACRNNPFARSFRSTRQGLVSMNAPAGTIIAYATSPGKTALDGSGVNGLYTQELLYQIQRSGLKIEDVFKNVRIEVMRKSDSQQVPWESSSLTGDFYFKPTQGQLASRISAANAGNMENGVFWKANQKDIFMKINGQEMINPKTYPFGNDLIAENPQTQERYLLRNYWKNRDGRFRPAEKLPATQADYYVKDNHSAEGTAEAGSFGTVRDSPSAQNISQNNTDGEILWKADPDGNLWVTLNGTDISKRIKYKREGNHLLVHDPVHNLQYRLTNFFQLMDKTWRKAVPVNDQEETLTTLPVQNAGAAPEKIRWRALHDGTYYLYVDGKEISKETTYRLDGYDLKVFHPPTGRTFLLKNFVNRLDNKIRKGTLIQGR
ncbi:MAG: caspase family protein [Bacteroidales bacterium]|nr:caspase family protein [Bacteroidales bacterium]